MWSVLYQQPCNQYCIRNYEKPIEINYKIEQTHKACQNGEPVRCVTTFNDIFEQIH